MQLTDECGVWIDLTSGGLHRRFLGQNLLVKYEPTLKLYIASINGKPAIDAADAVTARQRVQGIVMEEKEKQRRAFQEQMRQHNEQVGFGVWG